MQSKHKQTKCEILADYSFLGRYSLKRRYRIRHWIPMFIWTPCTINEKSQFILLFNLTLYSSSYQCEILTETNWQKNHLSQSLTKNFNFRFLHYSWKKTNRFSDLFSLKKLKDVKKLNKSFYIFYINYIENTSLIYHTN